MVYSSRPCSEMDKGKEECGLSETPHAFLDARQGTGATPRRYKLCSMRPLTELAGSTVGKLIRFLVAKLRRFRKNSRESEPDLGTIPDALRARGEPKDS